MPDWDATDAAVIAAMGETVSYLPNGGSSVDFVALFQTPDVEPDTQDINFESVGPMVTCLDTDTPSPDHLDTFTIRSQLYTVKRIEQDESALVIFQLLEGT